MVFDVYIRKTADFIAAMAAGGRPVQTFAVPSSVAALGKGLSVRVGPGANPGIILRSDTFLELGNPEAGSAAFFLFTENSGLVRDGRITLVGPDIPEAAGRSLPFGQALIIGGSALATGDYDALNETGFIGDGIEGYMVRSTARNIWSRVGRTAAARGFDLAMLGRALMFIYKSARPAIEAMEIVFVTSGAADVKAFGRIADQVQKLSREIVRENWQVKGVDIDCRLDCDACDDKPVCDDIREALKIRKAAGGPDPDRPAGGFSS